MSKLLNHQWEIYEKDVIGKSRPYALTEGTTTFENKLAFYAGCHIVIGLLEIAQRKGLMQEMLIQLRNELDEFAKTV